MCFQRLAKAAHVTINVLFAFQTPRSRSRHHLDGDIFRLADLHWRRGNGHFRGRLSTLFGFLCLTASFFFGLLFCQLAVKLIHFVEQPEFQSICLVRIASQRRDIVAAGGSLPDFLELLIVSRPLLVVVLLGGKHLQNTLPRLINRIENRGGFLLQNLDIAGHEPFPKFRQLRNVGIGLFLPGNGTHLCDDTFQLVIDNIGLAVIEDCKHIQRTGKDGRLLALKEGLDWLVVLRKVEEIIPLF